jgi:hypothetical protein
MKVSGVVMEVNKNKDRVTVYTSNGQFLEVPAPGHVINPGEIIEVSTKDTKKHKKVYLQEVFYPLPLRF